MSITIGTHRVRVTQEDIDNGQPKDGCKCPIALALARVFGEEVEVTYGGSLQLQFTSGYTVCASRAAEERAIDAFIDAFDAGQSVAPFEFDVFCEIEEPGEWD